MAIGGEGDRAAKATRIFHCVGHVVRAFFLAVDGVLHSVECLIQLSLSELKPIRFIAANSGVYFSKNSCNILILLQIFASYPLTICSL